MLNFMYSFFMFDFTYILFRSEWYFLFNCYTCCNCYTCRKSPRWFKGTSKVVGTMIQGNFQVIFTVMMHFELIIFFTTLWRLILFGWTNTTQKMKFFIKDFFSKCNLRIWSHLLKKSLMVFLCSVKQQRKVK